MKEQAMTRLLDADAVAALVRAVGVETALTELASCIRQDFLRWEAFDKTPRAAAHSREGVIELMPVSDGVQYAFKYVNGHPGNARHGLPTVMAFGVLAEVATGFPLLLADLTLATALRTAATSALAARALARPGARVMALIGNGAQAEFQALAFHKLTGVTEIRAFDTDQSATARLCRNLSAWRGLRVLPMTSVEAAVAGADIVTTATADKRRATILQPHMIQPGVHLNAVGGDCPGKTELHPDIVRHAHVCVEYAPQTRIEGEVQQMPADFPVTSLWEILAGTAPGRREPNEVTLFDSVGFALEDYAALRWLHATACMRHIGEYISLVATPPDAQDLFGWMMDEERESAAGQSGDEPAPKPERTVVLA